MVNVDIDSRIYEKLKEKVKNDKVKYPSVNFLVHKMIMEKIDDEM